MHNINLTQTTAKKFLRQVNSLSFVTVKCSFGLFVCLALILDSFCSFWAVFIEDKHFELERVAICLLRKIQEASWYKPLTGIHCLELLLKFYLPRAGLLLYFISITKIDRCAWHLPVEVYNKTYLCDDCELILLFVCFERFLFIFIR